MQTTRKIHNLQSLNFLQDCDLRIGIFGGSFNPIHQGHLQLSNQALKFLELDYIIWLISLQNPLKSEYKKDIFYRAREAAKIATHPKVLISTMEYDVNSNYAYDSLKILKRKFNSIDFIWLMGADNIQNFYKWHRYEDIPKLCKIVIFDRPNYSCHFNFSRFVMKFKGMIDKNQTNNIISKDIMIYHGIMSKTASSLIRK
jgi:nicotinate-nucleotide adenylyltransferase